MKLIDLLNAIWNVWRGNLAVGEVRDYVRYLADLRAGRVRPF